MSDERFETYPQDDIGDDLVKIFVIYGPWTAEGAVSLYQSLKDLESGSDDVAGIDAHDLLNVAVSTTWHLFSLEERKILRERSKALEFGDHDFVPMVVPKELDSLDRQSMADVLTNMDPNLLVDVTRGYLDRLDWRRIEEQSLPPKITNALIRLIDATKDVPTIPKRRYP
jgi:hypothetical protein